MHQLRAGREYGKFMGEVESRAVPKSCALVHTKYVGGVARGYAEWPDPMIKGSLSL